MKVTIALLLVMCLSSAGAAKNFKSGSPAVDQVSAVMTFPYPGFDGSVRFWSSAMIPRANGKARITRLSETTIIDARVDDLPPARSFGAEFNTYVLWLISPDGKLANAGEFLLQGDRSELHTRTSWGWFGMFVSAEPNCHVNVPSDIVVLVNASSVDGIVEPGQIAIIDYAQPTP